MGSPGPNQNGHRARVPEWLATLGIKEGDYFTDSKPRARRAMKSACFSGPARIHIYLGLQTMGFQQELAVKMDAGKRVPVQPVDVCAATGIDRRHFRQYMSCLESMGLAKIEGWTKGRFKIYSYAVPRPVDPQKIVTGAVTMYNSFAGCSPELKSLLDRYRIKVPKDFVTDAVTIQELQRLAEVTKQAELSLRQYIECHRERGAYKEERNGKKHIERNRPSSSSAVDSDTPKAEEEERRDLYQEFKSAYPAEHFDEGKTKPSFEGKPKAEQRRVLARLQIYLTCGRWKDAGGRWIPFASKWLQSYDADPPPALQKTTATAANDKERLRRIAAEVEEDRKWR